MGMVDGTTGRWSGTYCVLIYNLLAYGKQFYYHVYLRQGRSQVCPLSLKAENSWVEIVQSFYRCLSTRVWVSCFNHTAFFDPSPKQHIWKPFYAFHKLIQWNSSPRHNCITLVTGQGLTWAGHSLIYQPLRRRCAPPLAGGKWQHFHLHVKNEEQLHFSPTEQLLLIMLVTAIWSLLFIFQLFYSPVANCPALLFNFACHCPVAISACLSSGKRCNNLPCLAFYLVVVSL